MLTFKPVNAVVETESAETGDRGIACSESVQLWWADRNNRGQAGQPGAPETKELHRLRWGGGDGSSFTCKALGVLLLTQRKSHE